MRYTITVEESHDRTVMRKLFAAITRNTVDVDGKEKTLIFSVDTSKVQEQIMQLVTIGLRSGVISSCVIEAG